MGDIDAAVLEAWVAGRDLGDIATGLGVPMGEVEDVLERLQPSEAEHAARFAHRTGTPLLRGDRREQVVAGWEAGWSQREIARAMGVSAARVWQLLGERYLPAGTTRRRAAALARKAAERAAAQDALILEQAKTGVAASAIGASIGVPTSRVRAVLEAHGRVLPPPGHRITDQQITNSLRQYQRTVGGDISFEGYRAWARERGMPSATIVQRRFGSWRNACWVAGVSSGRKCPAGPEVAQR